MPQAGQSTGNDGYTEDDVPMMSVGPPTITDPNQVTTKPRQTPGGGAGGAGGMGGGFPGEDPMAASGDLGAGAPDDETGLAAPLPGGEPNDPAAAPMGGAAPAPGTFDPAANGGPVAQQHAETSGADAENADGDADDDGDDDTAEPDDAAKKKAVAHLRAKANRMLARVLADNPGLPRQAALALVKQAVEWGEVGDGAITQRITQIPIKHPPIGPNPWSGPHQQLDEKGRPRYDQYGNPLSDGEHHPGFVETNFDRVRNKVRPRREPGAGPVTFNDRAKALQERWRNRRSAPETPGPAPESEDSAPEPERAAAPTGPPSPQTVGDFARQQMDEFGDPKVKQDLWKQRYSQHPLGSDEPEPERPFGVVGRRR